VHASGRLDLSYAFICRLIGLGRGGAVDLAVRDVADTIFVHNDRIFLQVSGSQI